jgi:hypothetical protein
MLARQRPGCGLRASAHFDYRVCRYLPAGNVIGFTVLQPGCLQKTAEV